MLLDDDAGLIIITVINMYSIIYLLVLCESTQPIIRTRVPYNYVLDTRVWHSDSLHSAARVNLVQVVQVSCHLHSPLWLWNMDPASWLWKKVCVCVWGEGWGWVPRFRNHVPGEASPHLLLGAPDQRLGAEQDQLPCRSTGNSSGNCQEAEIGVIRAWVTCHDSPLQNYPSGHLAGLATAWSADEMLGGQRQRVCHARTAHSGLL